MIPFEMTMPMVRSASVSEEALRLIGKLLDQGKSNLRKSISHFIGSLNSYCGNESDESLQSKYTALKLRYNQILDQLDIFADVLSQRSEHGTGVWLSGLDALAEDAMKAGKDFYKAPPLMVYLERGHGAAIRRARTRLPGGDENPVAVIQIPRERMVGNGIASSLVHEVGHQCAALLGLTVSLKDEIKKYSETTGGNRHTWHCYERWISEIIADFWAIAQLGVSATLGLMSVVSLPGYFQFRINLHDPHPAPYIRVYLSCMFGKRLFPDPQWDRLWYLWRSFYPVNKLPRTKQDLLRQSENESDRLIDLIVFHKPPRLNGLRLIDLFDIPQRQPDHFREVFQSFRDNSGLLNNMTPILVFAVLGQAKADQRITSKEENLLLKQQLNRWAMKR